MRTCDVWTILSALGTIGTFVVAGLVFYFERRRQRKEKPHITVWVNCEDNGGAITLFNSGRESLPIKRLDVEDRGSIIHSLFKDGASIPGGAKLAIHNLVLEPNKVCELGLHCAGGSPGQFTLRFQLFDGTFKLMPIDPSFLGPYSFKMNS